jgi:hypothetical protein
MDKKEVIIYRFTDKEKGITFPIVPLTAKRKWMTESKEKYAYKCLPLNIANQYGFAVLSPADFTLDWWGGKNGGEVDFEIKSDDPDLADHFHSYFGEGTFTLHVDFVLKTPEGFSTYLRGVPNQAKHGVVPLDAIVETDWLTFTFTYNFILTEPGIYSFKKDEPLFCFFPIERNTVENFKLREARMEDDPNFLESFENYAKERNRLKEKDRSSPNPMGKPTFQHFYRDGVNSRGQKVSIKNHITNLIFGGKKARANNKQDKDS